MADKKYSYAGSISHAGPQVIKAPMPGQAKKGNTTSKKGTDLRTGK